SPNVLVPKLRFGNALVFATLLRLHVGDNGLLSLLATPLGAIHAQTSNANVRATPQSHISQDHYEDIAVSEALCCRTSLTADALLPARLGNRSSLCGPRGSRRVDLITILVFRS